MDNEKTKNDKFILMSLNDDKAGHIAEVLKNKTCKKILDFLAEIKEVSEKDIADALKMPINTVEYNLNKLIKSGLAEKTKNFFWSVKGKKIPMYKLARKHIIISPNKSPSINYLKTILPVIFALAAIAIFITIIGLIPEPIIQDNELKQFSSQTDLNNFIKENYDSSGYWGVFGGIVGGREVMMAETADTSVGGAQKASSSASDYSTTNIQVEGVDEADIVKNDGKYIYAVTGNKVVIVNAYPAENMEILSEIKDLKSVNQIFINNNKLIVFGAGQQDYENENNLKCAEGVKCIMPPIYSYKQGVFIYDISDKENPELEREIYYDGNYLNSRMIGDYVYIISNKYINIENPEPPIYWVDSVRQEIMAEDIYYWNYPDNNYVFTSVGALNINNGELNSETYLIGSSYTIYVSENNIYLTGQERMSSETYFNDLIEQVYYPLLDNEYDKKINNILDSEKLSYLKQKEIEKIIYDYSNSLKGQEKADFDKKLKQELEDFEIAVSKKLEKTTIHKININKNKINYIETGSVPGNVLNQFSMDEYKGYFRIAVTTGDSWKDTSLNHVYVLDNELKIIGSVEDLAKGERVYSARFLGDKLYLVTFRQTDPFYVIDLKNPEKPEVLGYLKIPGYSSYLHAYDENHIIGLGIENRNLKISMFDVSDFENPIEVDKYSFEGDYSSSDALYEHKAFLFSKDKNLLVIPVNYNTKGDYIQNQYGGYYNYNYWQGAFVFNINEKGFELKGKISHNQGDERYYSNVQRSLFMDDVLYTISQEKIKANDLDDLREISKITINDFNYDYPVIAYAEDTVERVL